MDWSDLVSAVKIENRPASWYHKYKINGNQIKWKTTPLYPDCQLLDLKDSLGYNFTETPHSIQFLLLKKKNTAFYVYVVKKERAPRKRHLKRNFLVDWNFNMCPGSQPKITSLEQQEACAILC